MSSNYWSSTTNANNPDKAWHVNFYNGNVNNNNKSNTYFMTIDKEILFKILEHKLLPRRDIETDALLYLLHRTIFHNCVDEHLFKGDPSMINKIPPHKSLLNMPQGKGLPIGNLTSQFLANVYLNELDQFVKHVLRCRFYIRYVDDCLIVSPNREQLLEWEKRINTFLEERLALRLRGKGKIKRLHEGSDFLGYIVRPSYILSRKRVVNNLKYRLAKFRDKMIQPIQLHGLNIRKIIMEPKDVTELRQIMASYLGHFKHANTFNLVSALFNTHPWLKEYFILHKGKLIDRFRYRGMFRSLRAQYMFFSARLEDTILLFRMGKFMEFYNHDAIKISKSLGLKMRKYFRGMEYAAGFPVLLERQFIKKRFAWERIWPFWAKG